MPLITLKAEGKSVCSLLTKIEQAWLV